MPTAYVAAPAPLATTRAARPLFLVRAPAREPLRQELPQRYWPCDFLHAFTLQMAAHGHCVSASMMLGDGSYASEQLGHALRLRDDTLRALTAELAAFFEASPEQPEGSRHDAKMA
jgi:hypothetical protein